MINENLTNTDTVQYLTFDDGILRVREELEKVLLTAPVPIRMQTEHLAQSRGKFIRAFSLLASAEREDGLIHPDAVKVAAAIELLHLATLVHDDIIDDAATRRGIITLQKKFGKHSAVICGDYLFCRSLQLANDISNKEEYSKLTVPDYMTRVCLGELRQNMNNKNYNFSVYQYLKIISGKTAALFEASFFAGAQLCEEAKAQAKLYARLGHHIGMIFQLTDDCIDYEASSEKAKKPVLSDFEQGVITLPLIFTFQNREDLKARADTALKEEINSEVLKSGGLSFTRMISRKYYDKAVGIIKLLRATDSKKDRLTAILNKAFQGLS